MVAWWHNVAFVNTFIVGREREKKKTSFSFSLLWESGIRCLFCSGGRLLAAGHKGVIESPGRHEWNWLQWEMWGKSNLFHFKEKMRPPCASQKCVHNDFILFIYFGGGLTLLYDSQERRNFALHLHNSLQEKRCISDLFPQWRRLIISFRRRECDRWINDMDHRGQEGAELWFTKSQLRARALGGDRGGAIADTSRRNTFPSQSLSVSSGTGWTDWISRRSRAKKKKKKPGEVVQMSDRHVERQPVSLITCGTCHSRKSIADKIIETESRLPFSVSGSYIVYSGSLSYWDTWIEQIHVLSDTVLCPVLWGSGWRMQR